LQFPMRSLGPPPLVFLLWHMLCFARCSSAAGVSATFPAMCRAPAVPRRHLQLLAAPRVTGTPVTFLAPPRWLSRAHATPPHRRSSCLCTPPHPFFSDSRVALASSLLIPLARLPSDRPESRTPPPPPSSTPVTSYSPWAAHSSPPRTTTTP
jgi:hypothetical protein